MQDIKTKIDKTAEPERKREIEREESEREREGVIISRAFIP